MKINMLIRIECGKPECITVIQEKEKGATITPYELFEVPLKLDVEAEKGRKKVIFCCWLWYPR